MGDPKRTSIIFEGMKGSLPATMDSKLFHALSALRDSPNVMYWDPEPGVQGPYVLWHIDNMVFGRINIPKRGRRLIAMYDNTKRDAEMDARAAIAMYSKGLGPKDKLTGDVQESIRKMISLVASSPRPVQKKKIDYSPWQKPDLSGLM